MGSSIVAWLALVLVVVVALPGSGGVEIGTVPFHSPVALDHAADSDTLFGWAPGPGYRLDSWDGVDWSPVWSFADSVWIVDAGCQDIYADPDAIYVAFRALRKIARLARHPYSFSWVCPMDCADGWFRDMARTDAGYLFAPVYGDNGTLCAELYRSGDSGVTWEKVLGESLGHLHGAYVDPAWGAVYVLRGDGTNSRVYRSDDQGETWLTLAAGLEARFAGMVCLNGVRVFGGDWFHIDEGVMVETINDVVFQPGCWLRGEYAAHIYTMAATHSGVVFAGTYRKRGTTARIGLYRRSRRGEWSLVREHGPNSRGGIHHMTEFDSEGWAYYVLRAETTDTLFTFRDVPDIPPPRRPVSRLVRPEGIKTGKAAIRRVHPTVRPQ